MLNRICIFLIGFGLLIIGLTYIIMYLNLMAIGYSLIDYFCFIFTRFECLLSIIGMILMLGATCWKGEKYDIHI